MCHLMTLKRTNKKNARMAHERMEQWPQAANARSHDHYVFQIADSGVCQLDVLQWGHNQLRSNQNETAY